MTNTKLVIVGARGMIKKETNKHSNNIPGSPNQYQIIVTNSISIIAKY